MASSATSKAGKAPAPAQNHPQNQQQTHLWSIRVADRQTGAERTLTLEASSADEAAEMIDRDRWLVSRAERAGDTWDTSDQRSDLPGPHPAPVRIVLPDDFDRRLFRAVYRGVSQALVALLVVLLIMGLLGVYALFVRF